MIELMFNDSVVFQICTTKSAGQQLIDVKNLLEKNFKENKNIEKYKDVLMKVSGIMTGGRPHTYFLS